MKRRAALAEDLRKFGLILLTSGVVAGFLQEQVSFWLASYTALMGMIVIAAGYLFTNEED